ncbi:sensor histidine kinase [Brevibacterium sp. BRM-1]|uniref:sensor histidine kinase n=1 Tax=Brevibacterium sp. BRM-1 TaxID=2999062 RepID=UPI00227DB52A|nr:sensor histidine kinase [Brevibacterium sp. BRM-1]WAL41010.1 sensor histidine kinase [Brevibacterium sp. BRM-1]
MEKTGGTTAELLRWMRVALHVSFAALLALGLLRSLAARPGAATAVLICALAAALAAVYVAGTSAEIRHAHHGSRFDPRPLAAAWFAVCASLWCGLVLMDANFSWLAFPLFFLAIHLLPRAWAALAIAALVGCVALAQAFHSPGRFDAAVVIGPVFGAALAVLVSVFYRRLVEDSLRHQRALAELEAAQSDLALSQHEAGRLAERNRLAADIHDTLAQGFSSIILLARAARAAGEEAGAGAGRLALIESTAAENLAQARTFFAAESAAADLPEQIAALARRTQEAAAAIGLDLSVEASVEGEPARVPEDTAAAVLRAAQSLLSNVLRHSGARRAHVGLAYWPDALSLDVVDDGRGFDPAADAGFGLRALRGRADAAGGDLAVESEPGAGTAVSLRLPLPARTQPTPPTAAEERPQ